MELRHLRCFMAVAEELHFSRAAERLHMEQSPLSRIIKELEEELGETLFARTTRSTRLTRAGRMLFENVPRIFTSLEQARDSVKAAANGFNGQIRIALSDGVLSPRFSSFLALCREEEPEIEVRLFEVPFSQQLRGLRNDLYDLGFAQSDEVGDGIFAEAIWGEPVMVALPARHPLLNYKQIPLEEVLHYPLVLVDPNACEGCARQINKILRRTHIEPLVAEKVATSDLMMTIVAAGLALGLAGSSQIAACRQRGVVARSLVDAGEMLTTYVLHPNNNSTELLVRFTERAKLQGLVAADKRINHQDEGDPESIES